VANDIKQQAHNLFMQGLDPSDILDRISDLAPSTLYGWIKSGNWKKKRESKILNQQQAGDILLSQLQTLIKKVDSILNELDSDSSDEGKDPIDRANEQAQLVVRFSDSISKISKSITSLFKDKDRLSQIIFSFGEFKDFISSQAKNFDDKFLLDLEKALQGFQQAMIKKYSSKNG
jgi:hypothetical protein